MANDGTNAFSHDDGCERRVVKEEGLRGMLREAVVGGYKVRRKPNDKNRLGWRRSNDDDGDGMETGEKEEKACFSDDGG
jgi:hypothetical protein